ncbi:nuclear transcription factor Y subunit gamma-like [Dorcoceras hygrometricum]|uniref:Nuclear transcription factor Y subunit gamma-like n=1 Tax=Dorcoceras hygrometricum TaxID=472368 RepID=A0A2Z7BYH5_9LAMI|nr:nuclear transcription factor Y subunit gamma-like [Dorcoceras hygrometricum]
MERKNGQSTNNRDGALFRSEPRPTSTTSSEFVLQWGNRKRLRCMKIQTNKDSSSGSGRPVTRVNRRVIRSDLSKDPNWLQQINAEKGNGNVNLRQRPPSPSHRILRNSESWIGMRGHSNGVKGLPSPDRGGDKIKASNSANHLNKKNSNINCNNQNDHHQGGGGSGGSGSSETAHEAKKSGVLSGHEPVPVVWPPKFVIALTNKEKEEDFMAIKGSKLPQRPKKRAKLIQRTVNLVCPGSWLCDLTLERYEVREKKVSKKRPRGLKAMGNMESDSE